MAHRLPVGIGVSDACGGVSIAELLKGIVAILMVTSPMALGAWWIWLDHREFMQRRRDEREAGEKE